MGPDWAGADRGETVKRIDDLYNERSAERERHFRTAVTAGATYVALMSTAAIQGAREGADLSSVRTAQFFLTLLAALTLRYIVGATRALSEAIVDDAARRHELELRTPNVDWTDREIALRAAKDRRDGFLTQHLGRRASAWLPRRGVSQRQAVALLGFVGAIPAAWFALSAPRTLGFDIAVIAVSALCLLTWVRLVAVGAKHWVWVDPRCGELVRLPSAGRPPRWWWWKRLGTEEAIEECLEGRSGLLRRERPAGLPRDCENLYARLYTEDREQSARSD